MSMSNKTPGLSGLVHEILAQVLREDPVSEAEESAVSKAPEQYRDPSVASYDDDGTMPQNVAEFAGTVVGRRVVEVTQATHRTELLLDDGRTVVLRDNDDCCAFTEMEGVVRHLPSLDHVITSVEARDGYQRWYLMADADEVLELQVGWSAGNPFYYTYGFEILVEGAE